MHKLLNGLLISSIVLTGASASYADLYISPVKANTKFVYEKEKPTIEPGVPGRVSFGRNLDLKMAIESTLSDPSQWRIHIEKGLSDKKVSWQGGTTSQTELNAIATQNNLFITINKDDRVIGAAKTPKIANGLAKPVPTVWYVNNQKPLSQNINEWLTKEGYQLNWKVNRDFNLTYNSILTGNLLGKTGVLEKVLKSVSSDKYQVYAETNTLMHVVTIKGKSL